MTVDEVAAGTLLTPTKISRLETGRTGATPRDIRDLCDLYGVTDSADREHLMALARQGKERAWWQHYGLPHATYIGLEAEAVSIRVFQAGTVPGLLQTEDYARAVQRAGLPRQSPDVIEQRVSVRLTRQAILTQSTPPVYHAILDEAVLHRAVGGAVAMRAQLQRIGEAAQLQKVTVQVIPNAAGAHPAMESTFCILDFEKPLVSDVVYVEGLVGNIYLERPADLARYREIFSVLQDMALSPQDSISLISKLGSS